MPTVHEPPKQVRPPETPQPSEPTRDPGVEDNKRVRSDRIHAMIVVTALIVLFALVILVAFLAPPPEGVEFGPWMML